LRKSRKDAGVRSVVVLGWVVRLWKTERAPSAFAARLRLHDAIDLRQAQGRPFAVNDGPAALRADKLGCDRDGFGLAHGSSFCLLDDAPSDPTRAERRVCDDRDRFFASERSALALVDRDYVCCWIIAPRGFDAVTRCDVLEQVRDTKNVEIVGVLERVHALTVLAFGRSVKRFF
jgi:hypothetical protein